MSLFPIMVDMAGKSCLVAGGGATALRKTRSLVEAGARITVVSPELDEGFASLPVRCEVRAVSAKDAAGMTLVIDATGSEETARMLQAACRKEGALFNCASSPQKGDTSFPAVLRRGSLVAGISTSGASPAAAAWVRDRLAESLPDAFDQILEQMQSLRERAKAMFPQQKHRAEFLHRCLETAVTNGQPLFEAEIEEARRKTAQ